MRRSTHRVLSVTSGAATAARVSRRSAGIHRCVASSADSAASPCGGGRSAPAYQYWQRRSNIKPDANQQGIFSITSTELQRLPVVEFGSRIVLVRTLEEDARIKDIFQAESLLGYDTEYRPSLTPSAKSPTSLVQLSSGSVCVLWHIKELGGIPPTLLDILQDPGKHKVSQGATTEMTVLKSEFQVVPRGFIDLHHIALSLKCSARSLQALAGMFLGRQLRKDLQMSDWEQVPLSRSQVVYAATDAWVTRQTLLAIRSYFQVDKLTCEKLIDPVRDGTPLSLSLVTPQIQHPTQAPPVSPSSGNGAAAPQRIIPHSFTYQPDFIHKQTSDGDGSPFAAEPPTSPSPPISHPSGRLPVAATFGRGGELFGGAAATGPSPRAVKTAPARRRGGGRGHGAKAGEAGSAAAGIDDNPVALKERDDVIRKILGQAHGALPPMTADTLVQSAQQTLSALCTREGHVLEFGGVESERGGFRWILSVRVGQDFLRFKSYTSHANIRDAQNDAALQALSALLTERAQPGNSGGPNTDSIQTPSEAAGEGESEPSSARVERRDRRALTALRKAEQRTMTTAFLPD
ncbi:unnamed protein product [Vitrella brassicaformis CCMP3155]|uniref:3'-5' exonuclease domain-containing protein n=3 Tax=Vitrella brassicaformis TaxID=1169539 RepID=A0A0G4EI13_VITBC|nr:unnamed protein product [Vitrella brassicaformis CCMP3155]|eukprot:CEL95605.1 unnamed protein product [Vitrella brassicaformis CCMP3155]